MTKPARKRRRRGAANRLTIREIASEAGVSTATVSRAFNRPELVNEATREKVRAVSERHHYVSDGLAIGLASRRSRLLGVIIPTLTNSIYASSTQAIQQAAQAAGYTVLVGVSDFSVEREAILIHQLVERRVEGLVLTGATRAADLYTKLANNGVPFIITWRLSGDAGLPCVSFDNYKAAGAAIDHLVSLGHRRVGLICGRTELNDRARDRRAAFEDAVARHGLDSGPGLIFERDFGFDEGREAMGRMLRRAAPPSAVFCANDIQAIGALYECRAAGLSVPRDMSIVGFDDLPISQYTTPRLTTVRVPAAEMGRRAIETLLRDPNAQSPRQAELATELVIRDSTAPVSDRAPGTDGRR